MERYNSTFYARDLEALRKLYVPSRDVSYFDNHADCDSFDLNNHLQKVGVFFATGNPVPLTIEAVRPFVFGESACVTAMLRYSNRPRPGVRSTVVFERHQGEWKIRHTHFSQDPTESVEVGEYAE